LIFFDKTLGKAEEYGRSLRRLVDDMFETMEVAKGVGLAAPQVGRSERLCVVDADDARLVVINPEIVHTEGGVIRGEEGCLSMPEIYADVDRHARVTVRAQDIDGAWYEVELASGLLGRCRHLSVGLRLLMRLA
jgi:peptide deformylase